MSHHEGPVVRRAKTQVAQAALAAVMLALAACEAPLEATPSTPMPPTETTVPVTSAPTTTAPTESTVPVTAAPTTTAPDTTTTTGATEVQPDDLTWGFDATQPDSRWAKPGIGIAYPDPAYASVLRRLTSAEGTRFNRNTYSRRQAENADGSSFLTYHGDAEYHVYDRVSGELVRRLAIHPDGEPQWHPTDPNIIRYTAGPNVYVGDLVLREVDVRTGTEVELADLTGRVQAEIPDGRYMLDMAEGSPSANGDRYAWVVADQNEDEVGLVSYDLATDSLLGITVDLPALIDTYGPIDWVSMSPTGTYVVAGFWDADVVFDADLSNPRVLNLEASHSDVALQADGSDAWVYIDFDDASSPDAGWLVSIDLDTLQRTRLFQVYGGANTSIHISGKGYRRPGWVLVSTYNCSDPGAWTCAKIMAVELGGDHRVLNLAHTYNCGEDYWTETQAVVNRDFTRAYFNSDGGSCGMDAEVYEVTIPYFE